MDENDRYYMRLALKEAKKGLGRTSPNPCVGAVIVKENRIIAKGYHKKAGTPHAEINALRKAGAEAVGSTMYVTLEPCNHTGRTPPCSQAVAASGVSRVVIGMLDPNPLVDGSGAEFLRASGIEIISGVLGEECRELNRPFFKYIQTNRPLVVVKAGISLDGKITYRKNSPGTITGSQSFRQVHRLRNSLDAIMVGRGTVSIDNPSLTTRLVKEGGRDPIRIILDTRLTISEEANVLSVPSEAPTWIFCSHRADREKRKRLEGNGVKIFPIDCGQDGKLKLAEVIDELGKRQITSVLAEGGAEVHGGLLREGLADRVHLFYAPIFVGDAGISVIQGYRTGSKDQAIKIADVKIKRHGEDFSLAGDIVYPE